MARPRSYSPAALEAARLLGRRIAEERRNRRWTLQELADRVGVSKPTMHKVEQGDPTVGLGVAFEAAAVVGVPLFDPDPSRRAFESTRSAERLALLPRRVRHPEMADDDF